MENLDWDAAFQGYRPNSNKVDYYRLTIPQSCSECPFYQKGADREEHCVFVDKTVYCPKEYSTN